jgi:hypothetical protein
VCERLKLDPLNADLTVEVGQEPVGEPPPRLSRWCRTDCPQPGPNRGTAAETSMLHGHRGFPVIRSRRQRPLPRLGLNRRRKVWRHCRWRWFRLDKLDEGASVADRPADELAAVQVRRTIGRVYWLHNRLRWRFSLARR